MENSFQNPVAQSFATQPNRVSTTQGCTEHRDCFLCSAPERQSSLKTVEEEPREREIKSPRNQGPSVRKERLKRGHGSGKGAKSENKAKRGKMPRE